MEELTYYDVCSLIWSVYNIQSTSHTSIQSTIHCDILSTSYCEIQSTSYYNIKVADQSVFDDSCLC